MLNKKMIDDAKLKSDPVIEDSNLSEVNSVANPLTLGQQLRLARETKKINQEMVAKQLFVSQKLISDLENDDYSKMVAPVYVRGYIISYARLLQIPIEPLMVEFAKIEPQLTCGSDTSNKNVSMKTLGQLSGNDLAADFHGKWFIYVGVIIILATLVLWSRHHYEQHLAIKTLEKAVPIPEAVVESDPATATSPAPLPLAGEGANVKASMDNSDNAVGETTDARESKVKISDKEVNSTDDVDKETAKDRNFQD